MGVTFLRVVWASVAAGLVVTACTTTSRESHEWTYDGPQSSCSTGPAYPFDTTFPPLDPKVTVRAPGCVARCGAVLEPHDYYGTPWSIDALPSGACTHDGEICQVERGAVRTRTCDDGRKVACSLTPYACRCEGGTWRCYQGPQGASACVCSLLDSGVPLDAGDSGRDGADADAAVRDE